MKRFLALLSLFTGCAHPALHAIPWRPAEPGDKWAPMAVAEAWKRVAKQVAEHGFDVDAASEPECIRRLGGWTVGVRAFESYRLVGMTPKPSCVGLTTGGGFEIVVQGDKVLETWVIE